MRIEECRTKAAMKVRPDTKMKLDLDKVRKRFKVLVDTPILLVIDEDGEIIVHNHGELLFKTLRDENRIREIAEEIYSCR